MNKDSQSRKFNLRRIRSFVRREGRITKGQQRALDELWPFYGLDLDAGVIDFAKVFQREAPTVLEIGFGNGKSLLTMAQVNPDKNYIGIDVHRPGVGSLLDGIEKTKLENLKVYCDDAVEVLQQCIPEVSLDLIQIFFPDPWPKKRHHKRRLIQPDFIEALRKKLKPQGVIHLATDWENYAEQMMEVLSATDGFENVAGDKQFSVAGDRPLTKFEQRGQRLGHGVWDLHFRKTD